MLLVPTARRRRVRSLIGAVLASFALVAVALVVPSTHGAAQAADLSKFDPGNIITDAVFFDKSAMTQAQIQAFLQAKVPTCAASATCLKDWRQPTVSKAADPMCGAYAGATSETAAAIIWKVAQACGVNPRVILVMLQKEQGLVTSVWPSAYAFDHAMGADCPDTTGCSAATAGFFAQVYKGVWQLKRYANPPGTSSFFTWYAPGKTWSILYSPTTSCGTKSVYIKNQATANLYYYTPYTPNTAALNAGYGTGDGCSSYGNRNFYNYFTDWFGSTQAPASTGAVLASLDSSRHVLGIDSAGTVRAYGMTGTGGWTAPVVVAKGWTDVTKLLSVGDLDGDGHRDVVGVAANGGAWLYPGDGLLGFGTRRTLPVGWTGAPLITAAGDFDGDGIPDVFTTNVAGQLLLWRGTDAGAVRAPLVVGNGWNVMTMLVGGGDFNGDGKPDLIARTTDGYLRLYLGNGTGGWAGVLTIGNGWGAMTQIVNAGDFTGDKIADLLAEDSAGNLTVYPGIGGGKIKAGPKVGNGWQAVGELTAAGPTAVSARVPQPGAGDVDGDRARDVLTLNQAGALTLYRGNGKGGWAGTRVIDAAWGAGTRTITLGDFNGDGIRDLGKITPDGVFWFVPGNGAGGYGAPVSIGNGWGAVDQVFGGIDFDGDRNMDVIARNAAGDLVLYRGNGAGGWAGTTTIGDGWGGATAIFSGGDFDGDGEPDVIARFNSGALMLYASNGRGGWRTWYQIGNGWNTMTSLSSPGDFDGTKTTDVLARTTDGRLMLYKGNGKGGWAGAVQIGNGWNGMSWIG